MKRTKLLQEPDNDNIDLRNIIIEDKKEADNGNVGAETALVKIADDLLFNLDKNMV